MEEETAPAATGHAWFTDCESFFSKLISPNTKQVDNKRLAWDNRDDCDEEVEIAEQSSSLDRHDRDAVRLLDEDDNILSIERSNEYWYLRYETYLGESRHRSQNKKWRASKKEQDVLQDLDD